MGGTSAVGIEMEDGRVLYKLCADYVGLEYAIQVILSDAKEVEEILSDGSPDRRVSPSVKDYLTDPSLFEDEDWQWRIVKLRDGRVVGKTEDMDGVYMHATLDSVLG
jgi:hypothetical protein